MSVINKHTVWGKIKDYPYIISIDGLVYGTVILKGEISNTGYKRVRLYGEKRVTKDSIHLLVLKTFISQRPLGKVCDHKDADKLNNNLENLHWVTQSYNVTKSTQERPGFSEVGYNNFIKKVNLSRKEWLEIRLKHAEIKAIGNRKLLNPSIKNLAKEYRLTERQIKSALYTEPRWAR